jgi:hypothetical protein
MMGSDIRARTLAILGEEILSAGRSEGRLSGGRGIVLMS